MPECVWNVTRVMADCVSYVAWSRDDKWLLSGGNDLVVKLWDARSGQHVRDFVKHTEPVTAIAWSPSPSLSLSHRHGLISLSLFEARLPPSLSSPSLSIKTLNPTLNPTLSASLISP